MRRAAGRVLAGLGVVLALAAGSGSRADAGESGRVTVSHALAQFGQPQFGPDFTHWPSANPGAPKGGKIILGAYGSFDSLNALILRGDTPRSIGLITDTLMVGSGEELAVAYGLLAERVEFPDDKSWIVFHLRPEARFHDGHPIEASDLVFAWNAIRQHGRPFLRAFLEPVETVTAEGPHRLKATFRTRDDIKPLLNLALVLGPEPEHWWSAAGRDIAKTTLEPILGSGPYRLGAVVPGRSITYERVADYWARDLAVRKGTNNFDIVQEDYYRDDTVLFEAFKAGAIDFRIENQAKRWTTEYEALPQLRDGRLIKRAIAIADPLGAQGFRFNTRRAKFADPRVREGIGYLFDFEWTQKNILYGQYRRTGSNFPNSDFGAAGPPGAEDVAILTPLRAGLRDPRILTEAFVPPRTDGSGNIRTGLREARRLFAEAGWTIQGQRLIETATGKPMSIEFLSVSQTMDRVILPFIENLRKAGIDATLRVVDTAQYQRRTDEFDFDIIVVNYNFFAPPGSELRSYYGSAAAELPGSANYPGIRDPVVDQLIDQVLAARDLATVKAATRALDRVLLWGFYMIPHWYNDQIWLAAWNKFGWPERSAKYSLDFRNSGFPDTWWVTAAAGQ